MKNPNTVDVTVERMKLTKKGLLTIRLSNPVRFPSYMKGEVRKGRRL